MKEINRQFIEYKYFDTSTKEGFKDAVKFQSDNSDWKLITKSFCDFEWLFERKKSCQEIEGQIYSHELDKWVNPEELISDCCEAKLMDFESDICSKCFEHCEAIIIK